MAALVKRFHTIRQVGRSAAGPAFLLSSGSRTGGLLVLFHYGTSFTLEFMNSFWIRALAVYALAVALTQKRGPGDVFKRARELVTATFGEEGNVAAGVQCPVCASFWLAWVVPRLPRRVVEALALAGVVVVVEKLAQGQKLEIAL